MESTVKLLPLTASDQVLLDKIEKEAETSINLCYQCGKCSAGCPVGFAMDYTPDRLSGCCSWVWLMRR